jgi:hypothetical protein
MRLDFLRALASTVSTLLVVIFTIVLLDMPTGAAGATPSLDPYCEMSIA